jgi:hypothetical protein
VVSDLSCLPSLHLTLISCAELRNRIYKAIIDDEGPEETRLRRSRPDGQSSSSERSLEDRNPSRQYLGLAQTNRVFRSEFMPLYTTVRRPLLVIQDVSYYLEAFPLPDPALNASIITILRDLLFAFEGETSTSDIDVLSLLRTDWDMFPFSIFASKFPLRSREVTREFPLLLLENSYDDLALYGGLWEETITAIYFIRRCLEYDFDSCSSDTEFHYYPSDIDLHYCPKDDEQYVELRLSAKIDAEASDFEKLRIFHNFVERVQARGCRRIEIRCLSGRLSMYCGGRKIFAVGLGVVKKACKIWSAKGRRYILAAKEQTNKAARNVSV